MRLRDIQLVLTNNLDFLTLNKVGDESNRIIIEGTKDLTRALHNIIELNLFEDEINSLFNDFNFSFIDDRVNLDKNNYNKIYNILNRLIDKVQLLIEAIEEVLPPQSENSISIKLPEYTDLSKSIGFMVWFDKSLNQILIGDYKSGIKLQNFDTGSNWFELILDNKESIPFVGSLISKCYQFLKKDYGESILFKKKLEKLDIEIEARKAVLESLNQNVKTEAAFLATQQMNDFNLDTTNNEYHTHLTHTIQTMAGYLIDGADVKAALEAPKDIKEIFPSPEEYKLLKETSQKLLENTKEENEEKEIDSLDNESNNE